MERDRGSVVSGGMIALYKRRARRKKKSSDCGRCSTALEEGEDVGKGRRPARGRRKENGQINNSTIFKFQISQ
ncbi:unnamed protein product [Anisakis simplex]|uniref:Uncharacterized protein n=1 Tax=Anisakis simplex TaxID=6269 RepID=A0A0M3J6X7_ANISI|nr:unnamed protein product [Anisakis simplex]